MLSPDWVVPAVGATADVLPLDDIGAMSWGALIEELFGAVMAGPGIVRGADVAGPLLVDCANTGLATAIKATEQTVIINLFMDLTPIAETGLWPMPTFPTGIPGFGSRNS
jgi:hypothetical protein